jgi:hypothetical protein
MQDVATVSSLFTMLWYAPAERLLGLVEVHAPAVGASLGLLPDALSPTEMAVLATACWFACGLIAWFAVRIVLRAVRVVEFALRNVAHYGHSTWKSLRTHWAVRLLRDRPGEAVVSLTAHAVDFSAVDVAVLTATATLKPGFAVSAPELAERLRRRPGEIQQSLEKLYRIKLLDVTLGSTDGFDNYVISTSGAALGSMLHDAKRHP